MSYVTCIAVPGVSMACVCHAACHMHSCVTYSLRQTSAWRMRSTFVMATTCLARGSMMRGWLRWACPPAATLSRFCTSSPPWPPPASCNQSPISCQVNTSTLLPAPPPYPQQSGDSKQPTFAGSQLCMFAESNKPAQAAHVPPATVHTWCAVSQVNNTCTPAVHQTKSRV